MDNIYTWTNSQFLISTNRSILDIDAIYAYLTRSAWAEGIDKETVEGAIQQSLCFGVFTENEQIGFARMITDGSTFGYLCDVYILEEWQNKKLGNWLIECVHLHPIIKGLRRVILATTTAPWLYEKHGYKPVNQKNYIWQIFKPDIYT
jgi:N-acetylglutamate synthase-like GNAT family acetyltransferase